MPSLEQDELPELTQLARPHPHAESMLSVDTEYFRIDRAAEILRCVASDLLHLGAVGKAEIMAPVVCPGVFKWPQGDAGIPFPEISGPLPVSFNQADRIILSAVDLSKIEAVGWTIPQSFYAPAAARRLIDQANLFINHDPEKLVNGIEVSKTTAFHFDVAIQSLRDASLYSPWVPEGLDKFIQNEDGDLEDLSDYVTPEYSPDIVTKIDHLFLSRSELQRLMDGLPQDEMAVERSKNDLKGINVENIGYLDRHASRRESLWKTVIYCLGQMKDSKFDIDDLIAKIDIEFQKLFPETQPLSAKQLRAYLTRTLNGNMSNPK